MKQIGLRSYQDIITPEEQERRDNERRLREIYEQEKAEYLADERRDKEMLENDGKRTYE